MDTIRLNITGLAIGIITQAIVIGISIGGLKERVKRLEETAIDDNRLAILETEIGFIKGYIREIKELLKKDFNK